jgi:hypothetical protein
MQVRGSMSGLMGDADWKLSMKVSQRGRRLDKERPELRSMLVHRLRAAPKAVARLPLASPITDAEPKDYSMFCEPCGYWNYKPDWEADWVCPTCGRVYVAEMVIFSEVTEEEDSSEHHADATAPRA